MGNAYTDYADIRTWYGKEWKDGTYEVFKTWSSEAHARSAEDEEEPAKVPLVPLEEDDEGNVKVPKPEDLEKPEVSRAYLREYIRRQWGQSCCLLQTMMAH